jgi:rhodanese-related sulfurtransferase
VVASDQEKAGVEEARSEIAGGSATAVDVRSDEEWSKGHVPGVLHLPDGDPEAGTKPVEGGARLMVIAKDGKLAMHAAKDLPPSSV